MKRDACPRKKSRIWELSVVLRALSTKEQRSRKSAKMLNLERFERQDGGIMPTDETRRLLRIFGVAVTEYEDAVNNRAPAEEVKKDEAEVRTRLREIEALIERLAASGK